MQMNLRLALGIRQSKRETIREQEVECRSTDTR